MYEVLSNDILAPNLHRLVVRAPRIAPVRKPGQFVIIRLGKGDERIPLTIGDADPAAGTITLFIQAIGASTRKIVAVPAGGFILDVAGPLGKPTHIDPLEAGGLYRRRCRHCGAFPAGQGAGRDGNPDYHRYRRPLQPVCDPGRRVGRPVGTTAHYHRRRQSRPQGLCHRGIDRSDRRSGAPPDAVFAVGPVPMMRAVAELTRPHGIETIVSLNPVMIDGTGMCGGCRVVVGGE